MAGGKGQIKYMVLQDGKERGNLGLPDLTLYFASLVYCIVLLNYYLHSKKLKKKHFIVLFGSSSYWNRILIVFMNLIVGSDK